MSRFYKPLLLTLAVCVLGYIAVRLVVKVEASKLAMAQPPTISIGEGESPPAPIQLTNPNALDPQTTPLAAGQALVVEVTEPLQAHDTEWWIKRLPAADHQQQIAAAVKELRQAKSDNDRNRAKERLHQLLASAFAADMAARQKQAAEIEARLNKLRSQFQAREELKDEILELQLKALAFDAGGLGELPEAASTFAPDQDQVAKTESALDPFNAIAELPGDRYEDPKPNSSTHPLQELKKTLPAVVSELTKLGHFQESPDGKFYVYVNSNQPHGPSEIRVVDSVTGKLIATAMVTSVVGPLGLTDAGVVTQEKDGSLPLRIPMRSLIGNDALHDLQANPAGLPILRTTPGTDTALPVADAPVSFLSEYKELRGQYQVAKQAVAIAESQFNARLAELQTEKPSTTVDDLKQQDPDAWQAVEKARADFEDAKRPLETSLKLLELDRRAAMSELEASKTEFERFVKLQQHNAVSASEVGTQRAEVQAAEIKLDRANTLLDLFRSITATSVQAQIEPQSAVPGLPASEAAVELSPPENDNAPKP